MLLALKSKTFKMYKSIKSLQCRSAQRAICLFLLCFSSHLLLGQSTIQRLLQKAGGQIDPNTVQQAINQINNANLDNRGQQQSVPQQQGSPQALVKTNKGILRVTPVRFSVDTSATAGFIYLSNRGYDPVVWHIAERLPTWINMERTEGYISPGEVDSIAFAVEGNTGKRGRYALIVFQNDGIRQEQSVSVRQEGAISQSRYFGYDFFLDAHRNVSTGYSNRYSEDYKLQAGDICLISMWGESVAQYQLEVQNNGSLFIPNHGQVQVQGYSIKQLKKRLTQVLARSFSTLSPSSGQPTSFIDVTVQQGTGVLAYVIGQVHRMGTMELGAASYALHALIEAGGPKEEGTLREVKIIREAKNVVATIDFYDYFLNGVLPKDIQLQSGDAVFVGNRLSTVQLLGDAVRTPAIFELKEGETLADLIRFAGGITAEADLSQVMIQRLSPDTGVRYTAIQYALGTKEDGKVKINPILLADGDIVTVYTHQGRNDAQTVSVRGAVFRGGKYVLKEGMTVKQLIEVAQGLTPEAVAYNATLYRSHNLIDKATYTLDLTKESDLNLKLNERDTLRIFSLREIRGNGMVSIGGSVKTSGSFPWGKGMKVSDLLLIGGIENDTNFLKNIYLVRADIFRKKEHALGYRIVPVNLQGIIDGNTTANLLLERNDSLHIYERSVTDKVKRVAIWGSVKLPGDYDMADNMSVKDLILQANGFTENADMSEVIIYRADPYSVTPDKLVETHRQQITPDMLNVFENDNPFPLLHRDIVVVRAVSNFEYQRVVEITGAVQKTGVYALPHVKSSLKEMLDLAGGTTEEAFIEGITVMRDSVRVSANLSRNAKARLEKMVVRSGDKIHVPKYPGIVYIEGAVNSPGIIQYREDWSLKKYIEAGGGYSLKIPARKYKTVVFYPSGAAKKGKRCMGAKKMREGSRILVQAIPLKTLAERATLLNTVSGAIQGILTLGISTISLIVALQK